MPFFALLLSLLLAAPETPDVCAVDPDPPVYYQIDLVSTGNVPGTKPATGIGAVTFAKSPFGIAVSPDGSYIYDLGISVEKLPPPREGAYVAWVSTPSLDEIRPLGALDADGRIRGRLAWNKFLVIITLEPSADDLGAIWQGPIILRGMSRSGLMHTMAGHGPFQDEPCATYGYF